MVKVGKKEIDVFNLVSLLAGGITIYGTITQQVVKTSTIGISGLGDLKLWIVGVFMLAIVLILKYSLSGKGSKKGIIKNPIGDKLVALLFISGAGWILFTKVTEPLVERYLGDSLLVNLGVIVLLLIIARKLMGQEFIYG